MNFSPTCYAISQRLTKLLGAVCTVTALATYIAPSAALANSAANSTENSTAQAGKAKSDQPKDYSHSMLLDLAGKSGVMALRLPQNFYMHAQSPQLADMRIFDSEGKKVAFALHQPPLARQKQQINLPGKIFPLQGGTELNNNDAALEMEIKRDAQGMLTSAKIKNNDVKRRGAGQLQALLLDFSQQDQAQAPYIESLRVQLPHPISEYNAQVWLAVSDDLQTWETIAASDLRWLVNQQGQHLVQDSIHFEARRFRYARITWSAGQALEFASVTARAANQAFIEPTLESLVLTPEQGKFPQDLQYNASPALPVEKIALHFKHPNVVLPLQIGSYRQLPVTKAGQAVKWEFLPQHSNVFYQIQQNGQTRRSVDMKIPVSHFGTWVIRTQDGAAIAQDKIPQLKISWQAGTVVFLSSGKGPYQLCFGRENINSGESPMHLVAPNFSIEELGKLEFIKPSAVQINPHYVASGSNTTEELGKSAQQRSYVLWAVLIAGVAVMGLLVLRLMKQMQSAKPE